MDTITKIIKTIDTKSMLIKSYFLNIRLGKITNHGERFDPKIGEMIGYHEKCHKARYIFAREQMGRQYTTVLDIACGLGYGSEILITKCIKKYVGVDNSIEAIKYANSHYHKNGIVSFINQDFFDYKDKSEVVISLETLEHLNRENFGQGLQHVFDLASKMLIGSVPYNEPPGGNKHHTFFYLTETAVRKQFSKNSKINISFSYQLPDGSISKKPTESTQNLLFVIKKN